MPPADDLQLLDDPQEWAAFGRLLDAAAGLWESQVVVGGMHCAACSVTVEDALRQVPRVQAAAVSASGRRVTIQWGLRCCPRLDVVLTENYAPAVNKRQLFSRGAL